MTHPNRIFNFLRKDIAMANSASTFFSQARKNSQTRAVSKNQSASTGAGARSLAGMLLAAIVAALLVVADQLIDTWADGHLLLMWVGLWTVAFAALAFLASPLRRFSTSAVATWSRWGQLWAVQREEAVLWELAQHDHRVMQDLRMAKAHAEYEMA